MKYYSAVLVKIVSLQGDRKKQMYRTKEWAAKMLLFTLQTGRFKNVINSVITGGGASYVEHRFIRSPETYLHLQ